MSEIITETKKIRYCVTFLDIGSFYLDSECLKIDITCAGVFEFNFVKVAIYPSMNIEFNRICVCLIGRIYLSLVCP